MHDYVNSCRCFVLQLWILFLLPHKLVGFPSFALLVTSFAGSLESDPLRTLLKCSNHRVFTSSSSFDKINSFLQFLAINKLEQRSSFEIQNYSRWERTCFYFIKLKFPLHKDTLWQVCLEMAQWYKSPLPFISFGEYGVGVSWLVEKGFTPYRQYIAI